MAGDEKDQLRARLRELLVEARERADLTQAELGKRLRRPQSFVSDYEGGQRRIEVAEFILIARALGSNPARMISGLADPGDTVDLSLR
jgi:transcriptional regulator with XRE-family HTH domain